MKKEKLAVIICCVLAIVLLGLAFGAPAVFRPQSKNDISASNDAWRLSVNGEGSEFVDLPVFMEAGKNDLLRVSKYFPPLHNSGLYLAIRSSQQAIRIYQDDTLIYEYGNPAGMPFGISPGSAWNFAKLDQQGGSVSIELSSEHPRYRGYVSEVYIGTPSALLLGLLGQSGSAVWQSVLGIFLGLGIVLIGLLTIGFISSSSFIYLGLFCLCASLWSLCESRVLDLFFPHPPFLLYISCLALMICPLFAIAFVRSLFHIRDIDLYKLAFWATIINIGVCMLLQLCGVIGLQNSIISTHYIIILDTIIMIWLVLGRYRDESKLNSGLFVFALFVLIVSALVDIGLYQYRIYFSDTPNISYGTIFRWGFWIFIILLFVVSSRQIFTTYALSYRVDVYKQMLNTDIMTGLSSRHAFDSDMQQWRQNSVISEDLHMLILDMNDLKQINDSLGHRAGDEAIVGLARNISNVFGELGKIYRIGGDEFVVIIDSIDEGGLESLLAALRAKTITQTPGGGAVGGSVAIGVGHFQPGEDADIYSLFSRVDSRMYQDKRRIKGERRKNWPKAEDLSTA